MTIDAVKILSSSNLPGKCLDPPEALVRWAFVLGRIKVSLNAKWLEGTLDMLLVRFDPCNVIPFNPASPNQTRLNDNQFPDTWCVRCIV